MTRHCDEHDQTLKHCAQAFEGTRCPGCGRHDASGIMDNGMRGDRASFQHACEDEPETFAWDAIEYADCSYLTANDDNACPTGARAE